MEVKANRFLSDFKAWPSTKNFINGTVIVGSYANGSFRKDSDVDLVIIVTDKERALEAVLKDFVYGEIEHLQREEWGILTSLRVFYRDGLEVEYGVVTQKWSSEPLDVGTKEVVSNGFKVLDEKGNIFESLRKFNRQEE